MRYGLSYRDVEELLAERGIEVDHVSVYRWVQRFTSLFDEAARSLRHATGDRWFVDEAYVKVAGRRWRYRYRAVHQYGQVVDVLLSEQRDTAAARRFFSRPVAVRAGACGALDDLLPAPGHVTEQYDNGNLVNHVTFFTNSDELWATFTETGKIVGTDDGTGATYTGHATAWGNFNMNEQNQNSEFTLTIHATGSDGTSITAHETTVFVMNANGTVTVNFDKFSLTCG